MTRVAASQRARALMERVLRGGGSLAAEYPLIFGPEPAGRVLMLEEQGEVRSAAAVLVRDFLAGGLSVRAGMIGSVVTAPRHRGRGLATRLLESAERELAQDGCVLAFLWADAPGFYEARGWQPVGGEVDFAVALEERERLVWTPGVRAAAPDDHGAIHRLYTLHRERVERSPRETSQLLGCPGMETLVLQRSRDIIAYSCMGRGADLGRTVHEWAGAPEDVLGLVRSHLDRAADRGEEEPLFVMTPGAATAHQRAFTDCGVIGSTGMLGHGKLLDLAGAADLLARVAGHEARFEVDGGEREGAVSVHGPRGGRTLDAAALLDLLSPAREETGAIDSLREETGLELKGLPLGLWAWGLDSI